MAATAITQRRLWASAVLATAALLSACGGGSSSTPAATTLSGTAAVGVPIVGGTVTVNCAGGSVLTSQPTSSTGGWTVTINGQTLPCATRVHGGTVNSVTNPTDYHSIAVSFGTVNITPLTDLVVAQLTGSVPATWFGDPASGRPAFSNVKADAIALALTAVKTNLGLSTTLDADPFTSKFTATTGDKMDNILEALKSALDTYAGKNYSNLVAALSGGTFTTDFSGFDGKLQSAYVPPSTGGSASSGATSCGTGETLLVYGGNTGKYTKGQGVCFTASATSLSFSGKTLTNPTKSIFIDSSDGYAYEVVIINTLQEINVAKSADFAKDGLGTFSLPAASVPATGGTGTLTVETSFLGNTASIQVPGVPKPASKTDFCSGITSDNSLTSLKAAGGSLTIDSCDFTGNVGTIAATLTFGAPIKYTIKYTYN